MERAISPNEVEVVNWLLDHALVDVTGYRLHPVEELRVVGRCACERGKVQKLADELAIYPDGQQAGVILWGREGKIIWLEVYDFQPESSPTVFRTSPIYALGMI